MLEDYLKEAATPGVGVEVTMSGEVLLNIRVPTARLEETQWILGVSPAIAAEVLSLGKRIFESTVFTDGDTQKLLDTHNQLLEDERARAKEKLFEKDESISVLHDQVTRMRGEYAAAEKEKLDAQSEVHREQIEQAQKFCANQVAFVQSQTAIENERMGAKHEAENALLLSKINHLESRLASEQTEGNRRLQEYQARLEPLLHDSVAALRSFAHDERTGVVGENLVQNVFDEFNVGFLEDLRHSKTPGSEDYLWSLPDENLKCSVEVKWVEKIHSQHDINKHVTRIQEAQRMNKINCGVFMSLKSPIPNTRQFEIKMIHQTPVLYVSGGAQLPPHLVAESGFKIIKAIWPFLRSTKKESEDDHTYAIALSHISDLFERQFHSLNILSNEIQGMTRQIAAMHRCMEKLDGVRSKMLEDILNVQIEHPILGEGKPKPLETTELVDRVLNHLEQHKKYPKTNEELAEPLPPGSDFKEVLKQAKKQRRER